MTPIRASIGADGEDGGITAISRDASMMPNDANEEKGRVAADLLYRMLAWRLKGFDRASPQRLYRKFIDTTGSIEVEDERVRVRLSKRAHNPLIKEAGLTGLTGPVPWLAGRPLFIDLP
jgi:hypothetical protein